MKSAPISERGLKEGDISKSITLVFVRLCDESVIDLGDVIDEETLENETGDFLAWYLGAELHSEGTVVLGTKLGMHYLKSQKSCVKILIRGRVFFEESKADDSPLPSKNRLDNLILQAFACNGTYFFSTLLGLPLDVQVSVSHDYKMSTDNIAICEIEGSQKEDSSLIKSESDSTMPSTISPMDESTMPVVGKSESESTAPSTNRTADESTMTTMVQPESDTTTWSLTSPVDESTMLATLKPENNSKTLSASESTLPFISFTTAAEGSGAVKAEVEQRGNDSDDKASKEAGDESTPSDGAEASSPGKLSSRTPPQDESSPTTAASQETMDSPVVEDISNSASGQETVESLDAESTSPTSRTQENEETSVAEETSETTVSEDTERSAGSAPVQGSSQEDITSLSNDEIFSDGDVFLGIPGEETNSRAGPDGVVSGVNEQQNAGIAESGAPKSGATVVGSVFAFLFVFASLIVLISVCRRQRQRAKAERWTEDGQSTDSSKYSTDSSKYSVGSDSTYSCGSDDPAL